MPFYEYECTKCNHQTEIFQKISDPPIKRCELCKGKMRRLISQTSFQLKGTGWYVTDYASKKGGYDVKTGKEDKNKAQKGPVKEAKGTDETPKKKEDLSKEIKKGKADD
jgi:putative FmdB family regulatory protein